MSKNQKKYYITIYQQNIEEPKELLQDNSQQMVNDQKNYHKTIYQ